MQWPLDCSLFLPSSRQCVWVASFEHCLRLCGRVHGHWYVGLQQSKCHECPREFNMQVYSPIRGIHWTGEVLSSSAPPHVLLYFGFISPLHLQYQQLRIPLSSRRQQKHTIPIRLIWPKGTRCRVGRRGFNRSSYRQYLQPSQTRIHGRGQYSPCLNTFTTSYLQLYLLLSSLPHCSVRPHAACTTSTYLPLQYHRLLHSPPLPYLAGSRVLAIPDGR